MILIILSAEPMFFFMMRDFKLVNLIEPSIYTKFEKRVYRILLRRLKGSETPLRWMESQYICQFKYQTVLYRELIIHTKKTLRINLRSFCNVFIVCARFNVLQYYLFSLAQESRNGTVRLNTNLSEVVSLSTQ